MIERRRLKSPQVVSLAEALTQAAPFTQTIDEVKAALADISYESVTLGQTQWEHVGAAVWAATGGSEEGLAAFDEWSKPWFYYTPEAARTRWNNCAASPPSIGADALLRMAKQARETKTKRAEADAERIAELAKKDKLEYDRERKAAAKGLGITRVKTLDKLVEEKRREKAPPPPPKIDIDKLKAAAKPILDSEDVLAKFAEAIRPRLAGEVANAKLLYLIYTTRYFAKPMNTAVKGLSAIGKSHLADRVLDFIPRESVVAFTTLSEKALYFLPEDLAHKILRMAEAVGSKEESLQDYLMREMISNHRITHRTTVKDPDTGQMVGHVIEREGPICFVTTTTKGKLHPEIETRILTLETDDTEGQTGKILEKIAEIEGGLVEVDFKPWHDFQLLLATGEHRVAIPYAKVLARNTARKTVRMRRDFSQVLRAIQAHALLHRERRERDDKGQIVATLADYAVVRALMGDRLAEASEVRLRKNVALTVQAVQQLQQQREHHDGVSTRAIVNKLNKDRTTVWRRLDLARQRGFVVNVAEGGREGLWRATGQPTEGTVLPTVDELKQALAAPAEEERQTPQNRSQQRNR